MSLNNFWSFRNKKKSVNSGNMPCKKSQGASLVSDVRPVTCRKRSGQTTLHLLRQYLIVCTHYLLPKEDYCPRGSKEEAEREEMV